MKKLTHRKNINNLTTNNYLLVIFLLIVLLNFLVSLKNYWSIFPISILLIYLIIKKINWVQITFGITVISIYLILLFFITPKFNLSYVINLINGKTNFFYIRDKTIKYIEQIYHNDVALSVIKLFIFNIKTNYMNEMLVNAKQLDILYLFTISGLHINLLLWIVRKTLKQNKIACEIAEWILIISMVYFLKLSIPSLRILSTKIFKYNFKNKDSISFSGILISLIFINIVNNYGFILSYGCTLCITCILDMNLKKYLEIILMNLICSLFSSFIIIVMNNKINAMSIIYNFCLSPFIMSWYLWIQFSFLIPYLQNIQEYIFNGFYWVMNIFSRIDFNIYLHSNIKSVFIIFYYPFMWLWLKN